MQAKGWEQISHGAVDHHANTITPPRLQITTLTDECINPFVSAGFYYVSV